jgi:hypothetical protein
MFPMTKELLTLEETMELFGFSEERVKSDKKRTDNKGMRTHQPHPVPMDSKVVTEGKRKGVDVDGRAVYEYQGHFYSWDRQEGEWEMFNKRLEHLGAMAAYLGRATKTVVRGRVLKWKVK